MHILYIHQYFTTRAGSIGTRSYEFSWRWVKAGHKVTMLTTTAQLTDSDLKDAKGSFFKRFTIDEIDVIALAVPYKQKMGALKRCLSFLAFMVLTSITALFIKNIDIVYATSTPLTIGIPAVVLKWLKGTPFIFEVRDQWPVSMIEMGVLKNRFLIRILSWLEKFIYKNSNCIVALSDGMAEGIREVAGQNKPIHVVHNGTDLDLFKPDIDGSAVRRDKNWGDKFVLIRPGTMGRTSGLDFIVNVAKKLRDRQDILLVLIGGGCNRIPLTNTAKELGLTNLQVLPPVPRAQLPTVLAAADVIMVVICEFKIIEKLASLNKFYDGLSAGKPMLLNYSGWNRQLVEDNEAGLGCKHYDVDEFVEKVLYLNSHRELWAKMGRNARRIAEEKFDRDKLAAQALDIILSIR